jgi:hypothetical protein
MSNSRLARARGRRQIAVVLGAVVAFGAFAAYRTQSGAQAHETTVDLGMTCAVAGALTVSYTVDHEPETGAVAGETFTLNVASSVVLNPSLPEIAVTGMAVTIPVPAGVTDGGAVEVSGGSFTKTGQSNAGANLVLDLAANPGTTTKNLAMPTLSIPVGVPAAAAGQTLTFAGPSSLAITADLGGTPINETCTAAAGNPPLVTTVVASGSAPGTGGGPTTSAPPTSAPKTTAPATTKAPTTTKAPATTVQPTTTVVVSGGQTGSSPAAVAVTAQPQFTG